MWAGIALLVVVGMVHLIEAPEYFESATYLGLLFLANFVGAILAAAGIYKGSWSWGWGFGAIVAASAFAGYVVSRTVGLPGLDETEFFEPMGILSLVFEGLFVVLCAVTITRKSEEFSTPVQ